MSSHLGVLHCMQQLFYGHYIVNLCLPAPTAENQRCIAGENNNQLKTMSINNQ